MAEIKWILMRVFNSGCKQNYVLIMNKALTKYDENEAEFENNGPVCGTVLCIGKKHGTHT